MKNIFVMGLDAFNHELLRTIPADEGGADAYQFHSLFDLAEIVDADRGEYLSLKDARQRARQAFAEMEGGPDAIMGYWDFPTTAYVPVIAHDAGLPAPPLAAVACCEHKYWSRVEQKKVLPGLVPNFQAINPFSGDPVADVRIEYPFWLKPVKSHSSFLGFYIDGPEALREHIPEIREKIGLFGKPFNEFLELVNPPDEVAEIDGYHCIAEEIISSGFQATVEGYCWHGEVQVFGTIDSLRSGKHHSSFSRYQYPSKLPRKVQARMIKAARTFMRHIGYDQGTFNIEFFWNHEDDSLKLLEVNSRISKSHSPLFLMVDGATNQKVVLELALGREPAMPRGKGDHALSGKFMLRLFKDEIRDGTVRKVPSQEDINRVRATYPHAFVQPLVEAGMKLSDLKFQDSYSYEIAVVFLGADRQKQLLDRFDEVEKFLPFQVDGGDE